MSVYALCTAQSGCKETPTWIPPQTQVYQKVRYFLHFGCHSRSQRSLFIISGWVAVAFLSYKAAHTDLENKVYDPFEILGISAVCIIQCSTLCSSRSVGSNNEGYQVAFQEAITRIVRVLFHALAWKFISFSHPDKVKATANETVEAIANRFVDITKAYKS